MAKIAKLQEVAVNALKPYEKNAKLHGQNQIEKLKASIEAFGFLTPCLIDHENNLIAGHGRVMAAKELGLETVPCVMIEDLTDEERRAYILADNRLSELGEWDDQIVQEELRRLYAEGFDIDLTGFELDLDLESADDQDAEAEDPTAKLPASRVFVFGISAFGVNAEKFVEIVLEPETAQHLLDAFARLPEGGVAEKLEAALNDL